MNPNPASQYKYLLKHFFGRFFDFEAVSAPQIDSIEKNALTIQFLALMVLPGLLCCLSMMPKYGWLMYRPAIERDPCRQVPPAVPVHDFHWIYCGI